MHKYIDKVNNMVNYPMILNSLSSGFLPFEKASGD